MYTKQKVAEKSIVPIPLQSMLKEVGPLVALLVLCGLFGAINHSFLSITNLAGIVEQGAILLVVATGMTFVILLGSIDLSAEGVIAVSSVIFALTVANNRTTLDLGVAAVLIGLVAGGLFGLVNGIIHVYLRVPSFIVTLGNGAVGLGIAKLMFGSEPPKILDQGIRELGLGKTLGISNIVLAAAIAFFVGIVFLRRTRVGRYAYVIGGDESVARLSGIHVNRYKIAVFTIAGGFFGLAGVLASARLGIGEVLIGEGLLFSAITAVVVGGTSLAGGRGGLWQTLVGVLIITVIANGLIMSGVSPYAQRIVEGIIIVVAIVAATWRLRERLRIIK